MRSQCMMFRIIPSRAGLRTGIRFLSLGVRPVGAGPLPTCMIKPTTTNIHSFNSISKSNTILQLQRSPMLGNITKIREITDPKVEDLGIKEHGNDSTGSSTPSMELDSVMRKRRYKIKKHKFRKRRKAQRAMRRKLKK